MKELATGFSNESDYSSPAALRTQGRKSGQQASRGPSGEERAYNLYPPDPTSSGLTPLLSAKLQKSHRLALTQWLLSYLSLKIDV